MAENDLKSQVDKAKEGVQDPSTSLFDESLQQSYTRWYPHRTVGNRPNIESTDPSTPKAQGSSDLENFGAYHFEIYFFPDGVTKSKTKDTKPSDFGVFGKYLGEKMSAVANTEPMKKVQTVAKEALAALGSAVATKENKGKIVIGAPMIRFKGSDSYKCHIYLPLDGYRTSRTSGIGEKDGAAADIGTSIVKYGVDQFAKSGIGSQALSSIAGSTGSSFRKMKAPRISSPNLEIFNFSWQLVPRNKKEMEHILDIIRFFQSASVPQFEPGDFFFNLPPVIFMEAITKDHTKKTSSKKQQLRPKRQFYITKIDTNFSEENGTVILSPEGFPMFITLTISMMKTDLTTYKELFAYPLM